MNQHADDDTQRKVRDYLKAMSDDEIFRMWDHVTGEGFHPDTEFAQLRLEDKMTDDEFVNVLAELVDERRRQPTQLSIAV